MGPLKALPKCIQMMVSILARFSFNTEASAFKCGHFDSSGFLDMTPGAWLGRSYQNRAEIRNGLPNLLYLLLVVYAG